MPGESHKFRLISAAHCVRNKHSTKAFAHYEIVAIFGAHNLSNPYEPGRLMESPKQIHVNGEWIPSNSDYDADLSLLEFWENKITFSDFIRPICLWNSENDPPVTEGIVTGWGKSQDSTGLSENEPKSVKALIQMNEDCFFDEGRLLGLSSRRTFCAGLRNGSGVCTGDSGGGLFIEVEGVYHLRGIVSSSLMKEGACDVLKNAVYTNVLKFKNWIKNITKLGEDTDDYEFELEDEDEGDDQPISFFTSAPTRMKDLYCTLDIMDSVRSGKINTCSVIKTIYSDNYTIESGTDDTVGAFQINANKEQKYLPNNIGEKFPNLKEFRANSCGFTIVRNHYFKRLAQLRFLNLYRNEISSIESGSFDDLVGLEVLGLSYNEISFLDRMLFAALTKLEKIYLSKNKIQTLSPTTFDILGGQLRILDLSENVCVDKYYNANNFFQVEQDLSNCN